MRKSDLLADLNPAQIAAVEHPLGVPARVLAGAGSGKTKVLTTRAALLIEEYGLKPSELLLVTFTNKASMEMSDRVECLTGLRLPFAGTFHKLGVLILRRYGSEIGIDPYFTIYDESDIVSLATQILKDEGYSTKEYKPRALLGMISQAKNELLDPKSYRELARGKFQEAAARLYSLYQSQLIKSQSLDFDDLLFYSVKLLREDKETREYLQQSFAHILIDEYQDTNTAQYELTKLLVGKDQNLFVVGDFSQAIYGWRGADYRNMLALEKDYPNIITYKLEQNYRSTQNILDAASNVIANNSSHPVLSLWTEQSEGSLIEIFEAQSDTEEVDEVIRKIRNFRSEYKLSDIAILYRTNAQSRAFEEKLIAYGIPYQLVGGLRFYERKEIKDLICYLRYLSAPTDTISLARIEKLGKRQAEKYKFFVSQKRDELLLIEEGASKNALSILDSVLQETKYIERFDQHDEEDAGRLENIEELRSLAGRFDNISEFLDTVALVEQESLKQKDDEKERLTLMSVHAAKGLEFSVVFIVGMEEGLFPHSRSLLDRDQMEEERRLCYVAITRAKERLLLSYARRRLVYGSVNGALASRFLNEIPSNVVNKKFDDFSRPSFQSVKKDNSILFDDPSIEDFLEGKLDVDKFLSS